jgi:hypothetical protein
MKLLRKLKLILLVTVCMLPICHSAPHSIKHKNVEYEFDKKDGGLSLKIKHFHADMFGLYIKEYGSDLLIYENSELTKYPLKQKQADKLLKIVNENFDLMTNDSDLPGIKFKLKQIPEDKSPGQNPESYNPESYNPEDKNPEDKNSGTVELEGEKIGNIIFSYKKDNTNFLEISFKQKVVEVPHFYSTHVDVGFARPVLDKKELAKLKQYFNNDNSSSDDSNDSYDSYDNDDVIDYTEEKSEINEGPKTWAEVQRQQKEEEDLLKEDSKKVMSLSKLFDDMDRDAPNSPRNIKINQKPHKIFKVKAYDETFKKLRSITQFDDLKKMLKEKICNEKTIKLVKQFNSSEIKEIPKGKRHELNTQTLSTENASVDETKNPNFETEYLDLVNILYEYICYNKRRRMH